MKPWSIALSLLAGFLMQSFSMNTWQEHSVTVALPTGASDFNTSDGYCNSVWDDSTGTLYGRTGVFYPGSGCKIDPGFYSNSFVVWKPFDDSARVLGVQTWGGGSYSAACVTPAWQADTTPLPRHYYDGFTYCKANHSIYLMLGAYGRMEPAPTSGADWENYMLDDTASTWRFSIAEKKWHRIRGSIRRFWPSIYTVSNYESHLRYWPQQNKLLFVDDKGTHLAEFDITTEQWTNTSANGRQSPFSLYNSRSCWDSKRALWIFREDINICAYDPAKKAFHLLPSCGIAGTGSAEKGAMISYDSKNDCYLVVGKDTKKTRYFSYNDGAWHAPVIADSVALPFPGYLTYDSSKGIHVLSYQHSFWTFALDTGAAVSAEKQNTHAKQVALSFSRNPFSGSVQIFGATSLSKITIFDLSGKKITEGNGPSFVWNAEKRAAGIYFVKMDTPGALSKTVRLIRY